MNRIFWKISACAILLTACRIFAAEQEITFQSSFDKTEQKACVYVPDSLVPKDGARPLLVVAHGMGCDRHQAGDLGYNDLAEKEKFYLICPELHGLNSDGKTSLAALSAQSDILDCVKLMQEKYRIDSARIYIAGRSMGGGMAALMALKHPDIFAAAVAGQGVNDLALWYKICPDFFHPMILKEMKTPPEEGNRFDYQRRSPVSFAANGYMIPVTLWHGTNDTWVPPELSERLFDALKAANKYQTPIFFRTGASHCEWNMPPEWVWSQLYTHRNMPECGFSVSGRWFRRIHFRTDEDMSVFYLTLIRKDKNAFAEVTADFQDGVLSVSGINLEKVLVNERKMPQKIKSSQASDGILLEIRH